MAAPSAIQGSLSLLGWGLVDPGAEVMFGGLGQAGRLCLGVQQQELCPITVFST